MSFKLQNDFDEDGYYIPHDYADSPVLPEDDIKIFKNFEKK